VILIVLESFRADAVGAMVNGKAVTPILDELARGGVSVQRAYSHNGYTTQSRYHIMAGSLAGLRTGTLIDDFKAQGYEVAYFSGQDESFGGAQFEVGFDRADVAFDARQAKDLRYSTFTTAGSLALPHTVVQSRVVEFLARRQKTRPLFLYINFHDTHYPYHHAGIAPLVSSAALPESQIQPSRIAALRETYLNTAANVDRAIGDTLRAVRQHLPAAPAVIVTADHGESLFDEGFLGHGYALNDAQTRIPLVVTGLPLLLEEPVGQIDLRDALAAALTNPPAPGAAPVVAARPDKAVFQYLGNLNRPRQIAFETATSTIAYDFRTQLARVDHDQWRPVDALSAEASARLRALVHYWERMVLARGRNARRAIRE
jgi:arylsulfatase A-like enzyme